MLFWLWIAAPAFPQGQVVFNNRVAGIVVAPVYDLDPADPTVVRRGNTSSGTPTGNQSYAGPPLAGRGFSAQLFGGPTNAVAGQLQALGVPTMFRSNDLAGFVVPPAQAVTVPGVSEGQRAKLRLRAWNNRGGAVSNWQQALSDRLVARGESETFISTPLGGISNTPPNLIGLESFNIALPASEPSAIHINFQTNGAAIPPGYLPDYGEVFGDRGNGLRYGWNFDLRAQARDRNSSTAPDQRYDTFVLMEPSPDAVWEIEVPNGIYQVHVAAGDAEDLAAVYRMAVEGALSVNGTPSPQGRFVEGVTVVRVEDRRLTISSAAGSFRNRICFINVVPVSGPRLDVGYVAPGVTIGFEGILNVHYEMQRSVDLSAWIGRGAAGHVSQDRFGFSDSASDSIAVYRAEILLPQPVQLVYSNDFEIGAGSEWSSTQRTISPAGGQTFLGRLGDGTVGLMLANLPTHSKLTATLDLIVIGDWDGVDRNGHRDALDWTVDSATVLEASFSNSTGGTQSYPATVLGGAFPARTGAASNNALGYAADSVYRLSFTLGHFGASAQIRFAARASQPLSKQSWGIDNVRVHVEQNPY